MTADLEWFGQAGHFCSADKCRFHLHTHVNGYCVSTVGAYFPNGGRGRAAMEPLGADPDRLYETMAFPLDPNGDTGGAELSCVSYAERDAANAGHAAEVERYAAAEPGAAVYERRQRNLATEEWIG